MLPAPPTLASYLTRLGKLRVDAQMVAGVRLEAPYKPALLLAVVEGVAEGSITDNRIGITPELVAAFKAHCRVLSPGPTYAAAPFALPFFHLRSSGFWHLHARPGRELVLTASHSVRSFGHLREVIAYAALDPALWHLLQQPEARGQVVQTLLARYFPLTRFGYRPRAGHEQLDVIAGQMLHETAATYRRHLDLGDEPDQFVRSGVFARQVLAAYDHTCAVSGLKLLDTGRAAAPLLDACHIVPWATSHDDTLPNGLALCPNLHRAFDRHLFWIDADYRVQIADWFDELGGADYGVRRFAGQRLRLPHQPAQWPAVENLAAQRG